MSQIDIRFFSHSLNRHTSFKMYIPDDKRNYGGVYDKQNMKTLFILHGYTQDGNNWIPEYISEKYNFAVVIPHGENSFWLDGLSTGHKYCTYVGEELIDYIRNTFGLAQTAEDTAIMGYSMGGFGALHRRGQRIGRDEGDDPQGRQDTGSEGAVVQGTRQRPFGQSPRGGYRRPREGQCQPRGEGAHRPEGGRTAQRQRFDHHGFGIDDLCVRRGDQARVPLASQRGDHVPQNLGAAQRRRGDQRRAAGRVRPQEVVVGDRRLRRGGAERFQLLEALLRGRRHRSGTRDHHLDDRGGEAHAGDDALGVEDHHSGRLVEVRAARFRPYLFARRDRRDCDRQPHFGAGGRHGRGGGCRSGDRIGRSRTARRYASG